MATGGNGAEGLKRIDQYVCAALSGLVANPAYNSVEAQKYLRAKKLTLEQLAVASGMDALVQLDKFLKGEVGGDTDENEKPKEGNLYVAE